METMSTNEKRRTEQRNGMEDIYYETGHRGWKKGSQLFVCDRDARLAREDGRQG